MTQFLTQFRIERLHGKKTITIPIENNRLVLVGENGTGKSTVANLIYYFLTRQWHRLQDYTFEAVEVTVSGSTMRITHDDLQSIIERSRLAHRFAARFRTQYGRHLYVDPNLTLFPEDTPEFNRALDQLVEEMDVPPPVARDMLRRYGKESKLPRSVAACVETMKSIDFGQFLYLPTYRRIEQDLKSIFHGIEIEEKVREFRARIRTREKSAFVELVEFGMEDVEKTISNRMATIKESVRTGLNNLTGTYLREVLRGLDDPAADVAVLQSIDPKVFGSIFARIEETTLPSSDKALLRAKIADIGNAQQLGPDDKVIAHFLSKLAALYQEQQTNEADVRHFVDLCNAYLAGKKLIYDDVNYAIYIRQHGPDATGKEEVDKLELRMLSSGEKQIVSLFSHIYFSGAHNYFVIIDEPELSLSVPWQQRFLPDIIDTEKCTGMVAVTHSPYIWDNALEPYVRSIAQFVQYDTVVR